MDAHLGDPMRTCADLFGLGDLSGFQPFRCAETEIRAPSFRVRTSAGDWLLEAFDHDVFGLDYVQYLCGYVGALSARELALELRSTRSGEPFASVEAEGRLYRVTCRAWIDGAPREPENWDDGYLTRVGAFLAEMHEAAAGWRPACPHPAWNFSVSASRECEQAAAWPVLDAERIGLLHTAAHRTDSALADLLRRPDLHCAIHGDPWHGNLLSGGDGFLVVDFEACGVGPRVYDVAVWLYSLDAFEGATDRSASFTRVLSGYESVRPLEAEERAAIPALAALRHFWLLSLEMRECMRARPNDTAAMEFYVSDHTAAINRLLHGHQKVE